jgi:hypothetical protein
VKEHPEKGVDRSTLVLAEELRGEDDEDTSLLKEMHGEATSYLSRFGWCRGIRRSWFGLGVGKVIAVFLFEIDPAGDDVDDEMWIVVGDLPSAVIVTEDRPDAVSALRGYIEEMRGWVAAVRSGNREALEDCLPIRAAPTPELAAALESRMDFLERELLPSL